MRTRLGSTKKRLTVIVVTAALILLGGGAAFAYWTSTGTGSGSATTGTSEDFVVDSGTATGGPLTPGGPSQTVPISVTNPGSGVQNLASVIVTVANDDGTAWTAVPGCSADDYTVGTPVFTYGPIAPSGVLNGSVTITMDETGISQDACKNAIVPLYIVAG